MVMRIGTHTATSTRADVCAVAAVESSTSRVGADKRKKEEVGKKEGSEEFSTVEIFWLFKGRPKNRLACTANYFKSIFSHRQVAVPSFRA